MSGNRGHRKLKCLTVFLKKFDIGVKWVKTNDPEDFRKAIDEKTRAVFVESVSNPGCTVSKIAEIAKVGNLRIHQPSPRLTGEYLGCS